MKNHPIARLSLVLASFAILCESRGFAASSTFTGASSVNWNVTNNWLSGALPGVGDDLIIPDTTVNNSVTLNDSAHTVGLIQMGTTGGRANPALAVFTINGNVTGTAAFPLTITNGVTATGNFNASGTAGLQIKTPTIIQGDQTWNIGGNVGSSTTDYGVQFTVGVAGTPRPLTLNGVLTKTGAGQLNLVGQTVGDGTIIINSGSVKFNAGSSTVLNVGGAGSVTVNNTGSLFLAKNSGTLIVTKPLIFNNGSTLRLGGNSAVLNLVGAPVTFNGTVPILLEYASLLLNFTNNWSGTINSTITGSGGTVGLFGNNSGLSGTINNNGTFKLQFGTANSGSAAVNWSLGNAAASYEIAGTATNLTFGALSGTAGTVRNSSSNGSPATLTVGTLNSNTTFAGTITDNTSSMSLVKVGTGTLTLTGANGYSGNTTVSNGTLSIQGNGTISSANTIVASGATLSGNNYAGSVATILDGGTIEADGTNALQVGSLTLGTGGTDKTTTQINVYQNGSISAGALTVNGTNVINILGPAPTVGLYTLISHSGGIGGAGLAGFKLGTIPFGVTAHLEDNGSAVQLNITAITVEPSVWVGNVVGAWNLSGGVEWKGANSGNPQDYHDLYPVFFDDSASNFTVNITATVQPGVMSVNSTHNYTWTGTGGITGVASLTKDGSGTLTIAENNTFSGGIFLSNGVLQLGNGGTAGSLTGPIVNNTALVFNRSDVAVSPGAISGPGTIEQRGPGVITLSGVNTYTGITTVTAGTLATGSATALGDVSSPTIVSNGATLDVAGQGLGIEPVSVQGPGVGGAGAIINSTVDNQNALRFVTLTGPTTFGGSFRWDIRDPVPANNPNGGVGALLTGNGYSLTKVGTNVIAFISAGDLGVSDINIMAGTLTLSRSTTPGNPANTITVFPGATLQFHRTSEFEDNVINKVLVMTNGILAVESNGLTNRFSGPVTLTGTNLVNIPAAGGLVLQGPVGGTGSLKVSAAGGLFQLSTNSTYSGGTSINGGIFVVDGTVGTGADSVTLTNATLVGSGTINDPLVIPTGSTLAPGDFGIGTLTVNGSVTLAAGSTSQFELTHDSLTNDVVSASGSVTYGGNLVLTNVGFSSLIPGDVYKLFKGSSYHGSFASISPASPAQGLVWVTNSLVTDGTIKVAVVSTPNPPVVISANSLVTNLIDVFFNMGVDPGSSQNPANYTLNTTNIVVGASQISSNRIQLALDSGLVGTNYTLHVQGVQNLDFVPATIATTNVAGIAYGFDTVASVISGGSAYAISNEIDIFASGADIFATSDQFTYVYKTVTNDFDYSVCMVTEGQSDPAAKAGLMVREINDPSVPTDGDRMVLVGGFPPPPGRNQNFWEYREDTYGTAIAPALPRPNATYPNNWLRLARTGSVITAYVSANNQDWTLLGSVDTATNNLGAYTNVVRLGLAATSHAGATLNQSVFQSFGTVAARVKLSESVSGTNVTLSWPASALGVTLQAATNLTPPTVWTNIPGSSTTNSIQIPLGSGNSFFRLAK